MSVFRVEKTRDYTIMANFHLKDRALSLKAKGLLSQMLSLPEDWDYTLKGLANINRDSIDAIRSAVHELEEAGYIVRIRERNELGHLKRAEYLIYECPRRACAPDEPISPESENPLQVVGAQSHPDPKFTNTNPQDGPHQRQTHSGRTSKPIHSPTSPTVLPIEGQSELCSPESENPTLVHSPSAPPASATPGLENPTKAKLAQEKHMQGKRTLLITNRSNTNSSRTKEYPSIHPLPSRSKASLDSLLRGIKVMPVESIRQLVQRNIEYYTLAANEHTHKRLDELVTIITDTLNSKRSHIHIAGEAHSSDVVKNRMLQLNSEHVLYVLECLEQNRSHIRNIRGYLLSALYNAPATMEHHYQAMVNHDTAPVFSPSCKI